MSAVSAETNPEWPPWVSRSAAAETGTSAGLRTITKGTPCPGGERLPGCPSDGLGPQRFQQLTEGLLREVRELGVARADIGLDLA